MKPSQPVKPVKPITRAIEVTTVHENTSQEIITITVDRIRLVLFQHKNGFERRKEWHTPLGIVITIALVFISSNFQNALGLKAETWNALFIIGLVVSIIWLLRAIYIAYKCPGIDEIVNKMKKSD